MLTLPHFLIWITAVVAIGGVIVRPWHLPEAVWPVLASGVLIASRLIALSTAANAAAKGADVYLFLTGMMLLAEFARREGLFAWLAAVAVKYARGSPRRLFALVYVVGTVVTMFLSNDATAVVLTPAVYAAASHAQTRPLPYLFVCAFIANAASFVLPISNPANLVVYGSHLPALGSWLAQFGAASVIAVAVTFLVLWFTQRADLRGGFATAIQVPTLSRGGLLVAVGIGLTAAVLLLASGFDWQLGMPTFIAGLVTAIAVCTATRSSPWNAMRCVSWSVLPLVAALFVLVAAVENTGVLRLLIGTVASHAAGSPHASGFILGTAAAVLCNLVNNLPLGFIAGSVASGAHLPPHLTGTLLIGVDLGPNLSVTGSLATILWLVALRREGQAVSAWKFLSVGCLVMPSALVATLGTFAWLGANG